MTLSPLLSTGSAKEDLSWHEEKIVDWDVKYRNKLDQAIHLLGLILVKEFAFRLVADDLTHHKLGGLISSCIKGNSFPPRCGFLTLDAHLSFCCYL